MTTSPRRVPKLKNRLRIGLVVPHIFMHRDILPQVIFSPGQLALDLAEGLQELGAEVTLFTPGPVATTVTNVTADLRLFGQELACRGDTYLDLLKKHPFTFITLARQVQGELIAAAYAAANAGTLDVVHVYTNEEEIALPFAQLCRVPVVFTHHDPFNFLVKYKNNLPKYAHLNWISLSMAQRQGMPLNTNWTATIYHGLNPRALTPLPQPANDYLAYFGRIIYPKGVHMAIAAAKKAGVPLKIAGKHYVGHAKDTYWREEVLPHIDGVQVEYVGFIKDYAAKQAFLGNARALIVPSLFEEPFGMVCIEALACGTPVIGFDSGAIPEIIKDGITGRVVPKKLGANGLATAIARVSFIERHACRMDFEARFSVMRMCAEYLAAYKNLRQSKNTPV